MKVCIVGAGWGGLSAAHSITLSENNASSEYNVDIYDRNDFIGGQSASVKMDKCYVESSWRVFFDDYVYVDKILKDLDVYNKNFQYLDKANIIYKDNQYSFKKFKGKSIEDIAKIFDLSFITIFKIKWLCFLPDTVLDFLYGNTSFIDFLGKNDLLIMIAGPILGQEAMKISVPAVIKAVRGMIVNTNDIHLTKWRVTKYPPNEAIFKIWTNFLHAKGVKFILDTPVTSLKYKKKCWYVKTKLGYKKYDKLIMACSLKTSISLLKSQFSYTSTYRNLIKMLPCLQNYLSVNFYFSEKFGEMPNFNWKTSKRTHIYIIIDKPWQPIIEVKTPIQGWNDMIKNDCKSIGEIWNVGVLDYIKGDGINKFLRDCNYEEAIQETVHQVRTNSIISKLRSISGKSFDEIFLGCEVFPYWKESSKKIVSTDPKFSLNATCEKFLIDSFPKDIPLAFSAYYCKSEHKGVSMERSAEIGTKVGISLIEKYQQELI